MPEAQVVIAEAKKVKEGTSTYGPWKLYLVKDGNGESFSTLKDEQFELAASLIGQRAKITYEVTEKGNRITELAGPLDNQEPPTPGTGNYIRSTPADQELLGKAVNNALAQAVASVNHTVSRDMSAKAVAELVEPLASAYVLWAKRELGLPITAEDIPFG